MSAYSGRVLVYGGRGALGAALVDYFKARNVWVLNVDLSKSDVADSNVVVDPMHCWMEQETRLLSGVENVLGDEKLDAILCVAGGWAGGNCKSAEFIKNADLMWHQSVWSSALSARIGALFLKPGGILQFTGAAAATAGTPGMVGYGMAKAAVHQLVRSLGDWKAAGLPEDACVFALLPVTLDTQMNRKWMPKADYSTWTPLSFVAETLFSWTFEKGQADRPKSGSLLKLETNNGETRIEEHV